MLYIVIYVLIGIAYFFALCATLRNMVEDDDPLVDEMEEDHTSSEVFCGFALVSIFWPISTLVAILRVAFFPREEFDEDQD